MVEIVPEGELSHAERKAKLEALFGGGPKNVPKAGPTPEPVKIEQPAEARGE